MGFSKNPLLDQKNPRWRRSAILDFDTKMQKRDFLEKLSNLVSCNWAFQSTHYWIPKIQDD